MYNHPMHRGTGIVPREIIRVGQIEIRFLLESADTGGSLAMFEFTVPAGARVPIPHSHERYDETIYGVEGVLTFTIAGETTQVGPGETCFIQRGCVHGFNNLGQSQATGVAIITPALLGAEFFRECAAIVNALPPRPPSPQDMARMNAVFAKHGLVPAPPAKQAN